MEINQDNQFYQPSEKKEVEKNIQENQNQISSQNLLKLKQLYNQCLCHQCKLLYDHPITIPCGHTFCKECIIRYIHSIPACPQCQYPLTINVQKIQENILAKSIVKEFMDLFVQKQQKKLSKFQQLAAKEIQQTSMQEQFFFFICFEFIIPFIDQTITLDLRKYQESQVQQLQKILQPDSQIIVAILNKENQYNKGSLVRILGVINNGNKIQFNVQAEEEMKILKTTNQTYQLPLQINLDLVKVKPIIQEVIQFNYDTVSQIRFLLDNIFDLLSIHIPQQINSFSNLSCFAFIQRQKIMPLLKSNDVLKNPKVLNQLSFIIPSILNLNAKDRQNIYNTENLIQRLILISRCLKKFENITNPFAVFKVPGDKTRENYYTELIVIIILFIFAFYYRVIGF